MGLGLREQPKWQGGTLVQQLSGMDASFLYFETPNAPMHIGSIAIYDPSTSPHGELSLEDVIENTRKRLHLARAFRQRAVPVPMNIDHPWWIEDPDFDIEYHIRHLALPKPGTWEQLCVQAARLHSRALDTSRPLWEFYVVEGLDAVDGIPPGSVAIVSKIHHAAIDGVSGAELTAAIHDLEPTAEPPAAPDTWKPEAEPSPFDLLARASVNLTVRPFRFARMMGRMVPAIGNVQRGLRRSELQLPSTQVPRTRFNTTITAHRAIDGRSFPLDAVRAAKASVPGATVNDAILAIVGGALRHYLEDKGELPEESLVAMAPISVRTETESGTAGNQVATMLVPLRTDIKDPQERLQAVHEGTQQSKALTNAVGARLLSEYSAMIPNGLMGLGARLYTRLGMANRAAVPFNTVVTNVPGPPIPLYSAGAKLLRLYGMGPVFDGMGIIHPVFSYGGQITVSVTSCREMLPDAPVYAEALQSSFEELVAATT